FSRVRSMRHHHRSRSASLRLFTTRGVRFALVLSMAFVVGARADVQTSSPPPAVTPQATTTYPAPEILVPLDVQSRTSLTIVEQLRHNHYLQKPLDDAESSAIFDKYLEELDPSRVYFMASDIQALEKYRYELDDALKKGDLAPAFDIFNRFQARLEERLEFLLGELDKGISKLDFAQ